MDSEHIDVSVVVLTYYHENYIAQALESILTQKTNLRYEILIGDDASGDQTPAILREYAEHYPDVIRLVLQEENVGATRNSAELRDMARGDFLACLDGDDYWIDPYKMQKQVDFLREHHEYIGCYGRCLVVDENSEPDYTRLPSFVWNKKDFTMADYLKYWKIPGQAGTEMLRNVYRDMDDSDRYFSCEAHRNVGDKTAALLLLARGKLYCSGEILSAYRYVNRADGHNHFSQHYANPYRNYDMFLYSCRLEDWAWMKLGIYEELGKQQKKTRFCRFVEECVHEPSLKRLSYLARMIKRSHAPGKYAWLVIKTLIEME